MPFKSGKSKLNETNCDHLLMMLLKELVNKMEKIVVNKQFNYMGALQFDKDLGMVAQWFASKTKRPVRVEFARLNQMSSLLGFEKVSEVSEHWGENAGNLIWRLNALEVMKVLSRRVEFSQKEIAALKL